MDFFAGTLPRNSDHCGKKLTNKLEKKKETLVHSVEGLPRHTDRSVHNLAEQCHFLLVHLVSKQFIGVLADEDKMVDHLCKENPI